MIDFFLLVLRFLSFVSITQLCSAGKRIVNIMKVYVKVNNLQLELIRYHNNCLLYSRLLFCKVTVSMQYRSPSIYQEVSNINHFDSVSESLGRLVAASQCMASNEKHKLNSKQITDSAFCSHLSFCKDWRLKLFYINSHFELRD